MTKLRRTRAQVKLTSVYDAAGNRASLPANINGTADFVNNYSYDELSRLIDITQQGVTRGNAVATKQVYFSLDAIGDVTGIYRSNNTTPGEQTTGPGYSTLTYNTEGLLTGIIHYHQSTALESMAWTYDALDRASTFSSNDGTATYGYDSVNEVTSAIYSTASGGHQPGNETYDFNLNGSQTSNGFVPGTDNLLSTDGTFDFNYDPEGNLVARTRISNAQANDHLTSYTWDAGNRLTDVEFFNNSNTLTEHVHYVYDVFDHLIERDVDPTGGGTYTEVTRYIWDGDNIVMAFNGSNDLIARYLNGPNTSAYDQYYTTLAEEDVTTPTSQGVVTWALVDNQDSVRDVIDSNGNVIDHIVYDSNGETAYESNPSVSRLLGWQGGYVDTATGQYDFGKRWYNPVDAVWDSQDPIGFAGGSTNLTESRANDPTNLSDPSGEILPLLVIGGLAGADIYIWWKNAVVIDAMRKNQPINATDTPYSLQYHKGLVCSSAVGATAAVATPVVASVLPAKAVTVVVISGSAYGVYSNGKQAVSDFQEGNYAQGVFHVGMSATSGYGGLQVGRSALGVNEVPRLDPVSEYMRFRQQGYWPRQARYLIDPYTGGEASHFLPQRWKWLPKRILESPYNVMRPNGISRGRFYERHGLGDPFSKSNRFPDSVGGCSWQRQNFMLRKYGTIDYLRSPIYALPDRTQGAITVVLVTAEGLIIVPTEGPDDTQPRIQLHMPNE